MPARGSSDRGADQSNLSRERGTGQVANQFWGWGFVGGQSKSRGRRPPRRGRPRPPRWPVPRQPRRPARQRRVCGGSRELVLDPPETNAPFPVGRLGRIGSLPEAVVRGRKCALSVQISSRASGWSASQRSTRRARSDRALHPRRRRGVREANRWALAWSWLYLVGQERLEFLPGVKQPAHHGSDRNPQRLGHFAVRQSAVHVQDERLPLALGQPDEGTRRSAASGRHGRVPCPAAASRPARTGPAGRPAAPGAGEHPACAGGRGRAPRCSRSAGATS